MKNKITKLELLVGIMLVPIAVICVMIILCGTFILTGSMNCFWDLYFIPFMEKYFVAYLTYATITVVLFAVCKFKRMKR